MGQLLSPFCQRLFLLRVVKFDLASRTAQALWQPWATRPRSTVAPPPVLNPLRIF